AQRILRRKSVHDEYYRKRLLVNEEHRPEIEMHMELSSIQMEQRLLRSKCSRAHGHMKLIRPLKISTMLKNKLPSGPTPGVGNAYVNVGGAKNRLRLENI
ncbi:hypothetical protein KI387_025539, partial [Taxus chinensis]